MPIKTFRGKMEDNTIDTIVLHTNNGTTGYKIVKFQLFPVSPTVQMSALAFIHSVKPTAAATTADFSDQTMLAAGLYTQDDASRNTPEDYTVVIDNMVFNQDIYVSYNDTLLASGEPVNYYIELEQVKLDLNENTVATLKDIRNIKGQ